MTVQGFFCTVIMTATVKSWAFNIQQIYDLRTFLIRSILIQTKSGYQSETT